jgi:hypothetical protein
MASRIETTQVDEFVDEEHLESDNEEREHEIESVIQSVVRDQAKGVEEQASSKSQNA